MPRPFPCSNTDQCSHRKPCKQIYQLSFSALARSFAISRVSWISILGMAGNAFSSNYFRAQAGSGGAADSAEPGAQGTVFPISFICGFAEGWSMQLQAFYAPLPPCFFYFSDERGDLGSCFCDFRVPTCPSLSGHWLSAWLQEPLELTPSETRAPSMTQRKRFFLKWRPVVYSETLSQLLSSFVF